MLPDAEVSETCHRLPMWRPAFCPKTSGNDLRVNTVRPLRRPPEASLWRGQTSCGKVSSSFVPKLALHIGNGPRKGATGATRCEETGPGRNPLPHYRSRKWHRFLAKSEPSAPMSAGISEQPRLPTSRALPGDTPIDLQNNLPRDGPGAIPSEIHAPCKLHG